MTEIIQPIPARIRNISNGGYVAGASDIFDDDIEKNQAAINAGIGKISAIVSMLNLSGMSTVSSVEDNYLKWAVVDSMDNVMMAVTQANKFEVFVSLDTILSAMVDTFSSIINNN